MRNQQKKRRLWTGRDFQNLETVDAAMIKDNQLQTLQYFSNISTVRDKCTKEQLSEFVDLYHQKGASHS